ncbi:MAG: ribose-phosphate pyrophosphokinase-like domain-containing protein, partial [Leptolyngbya sp. SIO1D8]|nr:ribose-phosphate pyrophosphokinase-like domain-containing protein [Leptolyngbya sp. SIO1D8]
MIRSATLPLQATLPALTDNSRLKLFSGSANVNLSREVTHYLGIDLGPMVRKRFADGELYIQIQESIRGCDVYLVQPTCQPVNDHLMELLIMIDACRRASARQITAVIP